LCPVATQFGKVDTLGEGYRRLLDDVGLSTDQDKASEKAKI